MLHRLTSGGAFVGVAGVCARIDLASLSRRAPQRAADIAYQLFCMPRFSRYRSADHGKLVERARHHLRKTVRLNVETAAGPVNVFEMRPETAAEEAAAARPRTVLLVHGWTSEASFMTALGEPLRRSGYRVLLIDCPAHGTSGRDRASLIDCARAVNGVVRALGPVDFIVAHSMGSLASLMAVAGEPPIAGPVPFDRCILIAAPNRFGEVAQRFGRDLRLGRAAQHGYERHLERVSHRSMPQFETAAFLRKLGRPALVIHAENDVDVPMSNAEEIAAACPSVRLIRFTDLGHRKILYAPPVIRAVIGFLREAR